jgi:type IV secretion system protein VirB2
MRTPHTPCRSTSSSSVGSRPRTVAWQALLAFMFIVAACPAWAGSPFATGAGQVQVNMLAILTPLAVVAVMGSGALAWFGRISWVWFIGAIVGTVLVFGAPQIVAWIRGMFGV